MSVEKKQGLLGAAGRARDHEGASLGRLSGRGDNWLLCYGDTVVAPPGSRPWGSPPLIGIPGGRGTRLPGLRARRAGALSPCRPLGASSRGVADSPGLALTRAIIWD